MARQAISNATCSTNYISGGRNAGDCRDCDFQLKEVYTSYSQTDVAKKRALPAIVAAASAADNAPMAALIER